MEPIYVVTAYIGDFPPANQPFWGERYTDVRIAREVADRTWDWLIGVVDSEFNELDQACVIVALEGDDDPRPDTVAYIRGAWRDE